MLIACGGTESVSPPSQVDGSLETPDMGLDAVASVEPECSIDSIRIDGNETSFDIFTYEASGAMATGVCSMPNVQPWHTVTHAEAAEACEDVSWRLCTLDELRRACGGPDRSRYPYGSRFVSGRCNIRDGYVPSDATMSTAAPTGHYERCVSAEGVFDLTGNVWEWTALESETYIYFGSGYRIIAERHRDDDHACDSYLTLPAVVGEPFKKETVGFRCCRDASD